MTAIAAGTQHNLALLPDGTVRAWGDNQAGQLGDGSTTDRPTQVAVAGLSGVTAIAAGGAHNQALLEDGTVRAWGANDFGQLGDNSTTDRPTPVAVHGLNGVTAIDAGGAAPIQAHSLALLGDGSVRAWGNNASGQLGDGTTTGRRTPVAVTGLTGMTAIAAGAFHSLAVELAALPVVDAGGDVGGEEGAAIALAGSVEAPGGGTAASTWTFTAGAGADAGATCTFADPDAPATTITCSDDGVFTATLTADGVSDDTQVTVTNAAPAITALDAPTDPVAVDTAVQVSAAFNDPGANDTHTCTIEWGDDSTTVVDPAGDPCAAEHAYTTAGVYTITVTDDSGLSDTRTHEYVVVYDPAGGFVSGGGWIDSPAGAYALDPGASGTARFGFVSRYRQGASIPEGQTRFEFRAANLDFRSTAYQWLVVSGPKAQFKGSGSVNGLDGFGFLLTANDGARPGGGDLDRVRIKIWNTLTGSVLYDNQAGEADTAPASTELGGGAIVIHDK